MSIESEYQKFLSNNLYPRQLKSLEPIQGFSAVYLEQNGKKLINFSSSDYLGLSQHPALITRAQEYAAQYGVGAAASRLVTGNFSYYTTLENKLAALMQKPAALILGSGFQTNISVLEALLDRQVLGEEPVILCDKLSHASIIAAVRHAGVLQRFRHNDLAHLKKLLEKYAQRKIFIIVESVYSMDGDRAKLAEIVELAAQYHAFLYVDDAHAVGVYGQDGFGLAREFAKDIPLIMGTFSKALGSFGGYVACSETIKHFLINKCKGLIYSTALSPAVVGAIDAALEILPTLQAEREKIFHHAARLRKFFQEQKINFGASDTHIIPWIVGDAELTRLMSCALAERGILATAIQPPSVPKDASRIRFCLSAAHADEDLDALIECLETRDCWVG